MLNGKLRITELLISVKNVDEALLALGAGADIIDLKDPSVGALGALDLSQTERIVQAINGCGYVSATVGEGHATLNELMTDIHARARLGVDIIKIAVSTLFYEPSFIVELKKLTSKGVKIIAVFFADEEINLNLLAKLLEPYGHYQRNPYFYAKAISQISTASNAVPMFNLILLLFLVHTRSKASL